MRFKHGIKIFFDLVQTQSREVVAKETARKVLANSDDAESIDALNTILWHIATHEIGHAMYGLESIKEVL